MIDPTMSSGLLRPDGTDCAVAFLSGHANDPVGDPPFAEHQQGDYQQRARVP